MLIDMQVGLEQRVQALAAEYGMLDKNFLADCTLRIHKRLGPLQTKQALASIAENRMEDFVRIVLVYYDKTYQKDLNKRDVSNVFSIDIQSTDSAENAQKILNFTSTVGKKHS